MKKGLSKKRVSSTKINVDEMYVVGIGASAGGLDALQVFFDNIPLNTGMAFCVVQHLSPNFKSMMDELLSRHSRMKISTAQDGEKIEPDHIYLNPNNYSIIIDNGKFKTVPKEPSGQLTLPIDKFFHSLAREYQEKSIAVILSGTGSDGSRGINSIKEVGGTIMVQEPQSAQFNGMPNSAISTGLAEYIRPPAELAMEIVKFPHKPSFIGKVNQGGTTTETENIFWKILDDIYKHTDVDFRQYKNNTLVRRMEKRMGILDISSINEYYDLIRDSKEERVALMKDFFIGVTNFFRDREAFNVLKKDILKELFSNLSPNEDLRIWSVGCSTGEEPYSIAILLMEYTLKHNLKNNFKIFATDVDIRALEKAAGGIFTDKDINDIDLEILSKYFIRIGDKYQIVKTIKIFFL